jgi:hypothetical protein
VGPNSDIQAERAHAEAASESKLDFLPLVTRHTAPDSERSGPLLGADMDVRPAPGIEDVATHRRAGSHAEGRIGDITDRQLGFGRDVVRQDIDADRVAVRIVLMRWIFDPTTSTRRRCRGADADLDGPEIHASHRP